MYKEIINMYREAKNVHHSLYDQLRSIESMFGASNLGEKVDLIYGLQKTSETLTDIRKQIDKLEKRLGTFTCMEMEHKQVGRLKTEHCSASLKQEQFANLPHKREKDPEKFDKIMASLGVPLEVAQQEGVRFHWPGFKEWFTKQQQQGFCLPDGLNPDDVYTEYTLSTRKLKDVDE